MKLHLWSINLKVKFHVQYSIKSFVLQQEQFDIQFTKNHIHQVTIGHCGTNSVTTTNNGSMNVFSRSAASHLNRPFTQQCLQLRSDLQKGKPSEQVTSYMS